MSSVSVTWEADAEAGDSGRLWTPADLVEGAKEALSSGRAGAARRLALAAAKSQPSLSDAWLILGWTASSREERERYIGRALEAMESSSEQEARLKEGAWELSVLRTRESQREGRAITLQNGFRMAASESLPAGAVADVAENVPTRRAPSVARANAQPEQWRRLLEAFGYVLATMIAQLLTIYGSHLGAILAWTILMLTLLVHGSVASDVRGRRFLLGTSVIPLLQLIQLALPTAGQSGIARELEVGTLSVLAWVISMRVMGLGRKSVGVAVPSWLIQWGIGLAGLALGVLGYWILGSPLAYAASSSQGFVGLMVALISSALRKELVFRGLVQHVAVEQLGEYGLFASALMYAIIEGGMTSLVGLGFAFVVALTFGLAARRSGSLLGVTLAHVLMDACAIAVGR